MKEIAVHIRWLIVALVSILLSWVTYSSFYNTNLKKEQKQFQKDFNLLEKRQGSLQKTLAQTISKNKTEDLWNLESLRHNEFDIFVYKSDSLLFWNSNEISVRRPSSGNRTHFVSRFKNGYYLVDRFDVLEYQIYVNSKIKNQFFYQNDVLKNTVSHHFNTSNNIKIEWESTETNIPITSIDGNVLFYLTILKEKSIGKYPQLFSFLFYLFSIVSLLISLSLFLLPIAGKQKVLIPIYPLFLIAIRYLSIKYSWIELFNDFDLFNPELYANSRLIPHLGSLIITFAVVGIIIWWVAIFIRQIKELERKTWILFCLYIGLLVYGFVIGEVFESLIINSTISLVIDKVFSLNLYSFIALVLIAFIFLSYYILARIICIKIIASNFPQNQLAVFWFITGVIFVLLEIFYLQEYIVNALCPLAINGILLFLAAKTTRLYSLKFHLLIITIFAFYSALIIYHNNEINEHQKRELFANQLITDQDPVMEIQYDATINALINSAEFHQIVKNNDYFTAPNFSSQIENCCFDDYWEKYELSFFIFHPNGTPLMDYLSVDSRGEEELKHIIEQHSTPSSIAEGLYFVNDYYNQISYVGFQPIKQVDGSIMNFYVLFKSKKIPEKIGFPRLLMNEKSYALQNLEDYSIARYSDGELVMLFGNYNYPTTIRFFKKKQNKSNSGFISTNGINHYLMEQEDGQAVVISIPEKRFIERMSTFSYLEIFFLLFTMIVLIPTRWKIIFPMKTLNLSLKVQLVLISMVVFAFIVFTIVATENGANQYTVYTQNNLKEKITSVKAEIQQLLGDKPASFAQENEDYINFILKRLSSIFTTDINFYSLTGEVIASSQPKLYEKGISSKQMNSEAFYAMNYQKRSEFVHRENFGELSFFSGYVPYENYDSHHIGYINLQHFSRQNIFEKQMNDFVVTIINLAVLLLVVTIIMAIVVANWITEPLRQIQMSFRQVEFGKKNKPIDYQGNDEIGALVKDYNAKLVELEIKAMQLAKSERESAWREMAKQVAHEIKNPLTPMKLSIQQFQRSFDPHNPYAQENIQRLTNSLVEQIDGLTKIANEFSNFAKMPKANEEMLDLIPILRNLRDLYGSQFVNLLLDYDKSKQHVIFADKDLFIRVFNNLIKNAIQATPENRNPHIHIAIEKEESNFLISIEDNGDGIPEEMKDKIFTPNFTTKSTGSGLGLAMVKQIISTHNGEIWFTSEKTKGTTFFIRLPVPKE